MELKILGSICFLEAVGTVGNIMGYHLGAGICLAGTSLLTVFAVDFLFHPDIDLQHISYPQQILFF